MKKKNSKNIQTDVTADYLRDRLDPALRSER